MSATDALRAAEAVGLVVATDGVDLVLKAACPPPPDVLAALSRHKADIVALLSQRADAAMPITPQRSDWDAADWRGRYDELAGSLEYESSLARADAEDRAYLALLDEWLSVNPEARRRHGTQAVFVAMGALRRHGIAPSAERLRAEAEARALVEVAEEEPLAAAVLPSVRTGATLGEAA